MTSPHREAPLFLLDVPDGWVRSDGSPVFALIAQPPEWPGVQVPTIVVVLTAVEPGTGIEAYLASQLEGAATHLGDAVLIDAGVDHEHRAIDLLIAHDHDGRAVTCRQRHVLGDGDWAVGASATVADGDWPAMGGVVSAAVESLRVNR
jgi:hypothetical protein